MAFAPYPEDNSHRLLVLSDYPCAPTTTSRIIRVNNARLHESRIQIKAEVLAFMMHSGK
jgi:hypothetical protein